MIRVHRPLQIPNTLSTAGTVKRDEHCLSAEQGETEFRFRADIYGAGDVKSALVAAQHGKCCFCERRVREDGNVEHFRPKASAKQKQGAPLLRPGYYWLAYDWSNLLLACSPCNSRHKGSLFPLINPRGRIRSHSQPGKLSREKPLFIDPVAEDPSQHIEFRDEIPVARQGSVRGDATIKALALDRPALNSIRLERLLDLRRYQDFLQVAQSHPEDPE